MAQRAETTPGKPTAIKIGASVFSFRGAGSGPQTEAGRKAKQAIDAACWALVAAEGELAEMDRVTGDGDLGANMARAAKAMQDSAYPLDDIPATLKALGHTLRRELGGSSGPLWAALFLRCGSALEGVRTTGLANVGRSLASGLPGHQRIGWRQSRATAPCWMYSILLAKTLQQAAGSKVTPDAVVAALEAAERGAEETAQMKPRLGRSSYLGDRVLGYPDPGAKAVSIWLRAARNALFSSTLKDFDPFNCVAICNKTGTQVASNAGRGRHSRINNLCIANLYNQTYGFFLCLRGWSQSCIGSWIGSWRR